MLICAEGSGSAERVRRALGLRRRDVMVIVADVYRLRGLLPDRIYITAGFVSLPSTCDLWRVLRARAGAAGLTLPEEPRDGYYELTTPAASWPPSRS